MKKISVLLSVVIALGAFLFVACSEQDGLEKSTRSVEIGLDISVADLVQTKAGALDGDNELVPYCDAGFDFDGYAKAVYSIVFSDGTNGPAGTWYWPISVEEGNDIYTKRISDLKQIDFPSEKVTATLTFSDFRVYADEDFEMTDNVVVAAENDSLMFITPAQGSAYEAYLEPGMAVDKSFEVGMYQKVYMNMQVLCFNEEAIPLFGFAWADFDVVYGDEICMFFNCTDDERGTYHSTLSKGVEAFMFESTTAYWTGESAGAFCIPCPGNWEANGFDIVVDGYDKITISKDIIIDFLGADDLTVKEESDPIQSGNGYYITLDFANDQPFLHFYFDDCK